MASGITLKMRAIKVPVPELLKRGNPEHYYPRPDFGGIRVHAFVADTDRAQYRHMARTVREAEQRRRALRLAGLDEDVA